MKVQPSSVSLGVLRITEVSFAVSTPKAPEHETVQKASSVTYRRASISKVRLLGKAKLAGAVKATLETGTISMITVSCWAMLSEVKKPAVNVAVPAAAPAAIT